MLQTRELIQSMFHIARVTRRISRNPNDSWEGQETDGIAGDANDLARDLLV
jgi:hypothetical protein